MSVKKQIVFIIAAKLIDIELLSKTIDVLVVGNVAGSPVGQKILRKLASRGGGDCQ